MFKANYLQLDGELNIIAHSERNYALNSDDASNVHKVGLKPIDIIDAQQEPDTITEITVTGLSTSVISRGDTILILNKDTLEVVETFTCAAQTSVGDTTITIESITTTNLITVGMLVVFSGKVSSDNVYVGDSNHNSFTRVLKCQTVDTNPVEATSDREAGDSYINRIVVPTNCCMGIRFDIVGKRNGSSNLFFGSRRCCFRSTSSSTVLYSTVQTDGVDFSSGSLLTNFAVTANDTDDTITVTITSIADTINWTITCHCTVAKDG